MTDNELLLAISNIVHSEVSDLRSDITDMRSDIKNLYDEQHNMRSDIDDMRSDIKNLYDEQRNMRSDINDLRSDIKNLYDEQRNMRTDINDLRSFVQDEAQKNLSTRLLLENEVIPRLQNIESCYTTTYSRYANGIQQLDTIQKDVDVLKLVVAEHSEILKKIS